MIIYIITAVIFGMLFLTKERWYYAVSIPESVGLISIDFTLLSAFHFLIKKVGVTKLSVFITMSKNLTTIY